MITYVIGVITSSLRLTTTMSLGGLLTFKQKLVDVAGGSWMIFPALMQFVQYTEIGDTLNSTSVNGT
jgi:hypothetical protein